METAEAPAYQRAENDAFYTEPKLATALVETLVGDGWIEPDLESVLEPSVGKGAFIDAIRPHLDEERASVTAIDIDAAAIAALRKAPRFGGRMIHLVGDFITEGDLTGGDSYDLIIGNPPFGKAVEGRKIPVAVAEKHVRRALHLRRRGGVAAFLLRVAFFESVERIPFWRMNPASAFYPVPERPSFTGNGKSDKGQAYGFFVWKRGHRGPGVLGSPILWRGE